MGYHESRPYFKQGIGEDRICFSGGRLALDLARHGGITRINYYGSQRFADATYFRADPLSAWASLYRPVLRFDGLRRYVLEFNDTVIYPNGYISKCSFEGVNFRHEMWLDNEEMVFLLKVVSGFPVDNLEFQLINTDVCTRLEKGTRTWRQLDGSVPLFEITDHYSNEAVAAEKQAGYLTLAQRGDAYVPQMQTAISHFAIAGSEVVEWTETPRVFRKYYASMRVEKDEACYILGFGHKGPEELRTRLVSRVKQRGQGIAVPTYDNPVIKFPDAAIASFLMNSGDILDSLKIKDMPGGMRAADSGYWIWGWDSMVYADALGFLNQTGYIVDMLDFYQRTADELRGVFHEMTIDGRPYLSMAYPPQCLYVVMLYWAYVFGGDKCVLREYLPFAREIIRRAGQDEVKDSGLISGVALYPDHPEDLEQDGNDISSFNNSIYYQALRAISGMLAEVGDTEAAAGYDRMAEKTSAAFDQLYDQERHYFYDSISSTDFSPRLHYPVYAVMYVTPFADELLKGKKSDVAAFMTREFSSRQGCRILPLWDSRYMYDGNQLGMYMPVTERFFREMHYYIDPPGAVAKFHNDIRWNWLKLTLPEALSCEYENHGITPDNPGRKQSFTLKSWVSGFYRFSAGMTFSIAGIHFGDFSESSLEVNNLKVRNAVISVTMRGGGAVESLMLNGRKLESKCFIPFSELQGNCQIIVIRNGK